jgi:ribosomal subunit interface protein
MQPVKIVIRDMPNSPAIEDHIRKKAQKLSQFNQRINNFRVVVEVPQKHKRQGKLFNVRIDLTVPGRELVINRKLDEDVYIAIRDAFAALIRQLESYAQKRRGDVKTHESANYGYVKRLFLDEGYGFIQGVDGNEFYFSPTNVTYPSFDQLAIGDIVEFVSMPSGDGLQAHHVTKEKKNHVKEETF